MVSTRCCDIVDKRDEWPEPLKKAYESQTVTTPEEALIVILHSMLLECGFHQCNNDDSSVGSPLPHAACFEATSTHYSSSYRHEMITSFPVHLKYILIGKSVAVHGIFDDDERCLSFSVKTGDFVLKENDSFSYKCIASLSRDFKDRFVYSLISELEALANIWPTFGLAVMPYDIVLYIVSYLNSKDLSSMAKVLRSFNNVSRSARLR